jgi:hypothetical protein
MTNDQKILTVCVSDPALLPDLGLGIHRAFAAHPVQRGQLEASVFNALCPVQEHSIFGVGVMAGGQRQPDEIAAQATLAKGRDQQWVAKHQR